MSDILDYIRNVVDPELEAIRAERNRLAHQLGVLRYQQDRRARALERSVDLQHTLALLATQQLAVTRVRAEAEGRRLARHATIGDPV